MFTDEFTYWDKVFIWAVILFAVFGILFVFRDIGYAQTISRTVYESANVAAAPIGQNDSDSYTGARNLESANNVTTTRTVGQYYSAGDTRYSVGRTTLRFNMKTVPRSTATAGTLYVYVQSKFTSPDFDMRVVSSYAKGLQATHWQGWFNDIAGWAASGAYSPVYYADAINTADITAGQWLAIPFNSTGLDSIAPYTELDTLSVTLMSSIDIAGNAPTGAEYIQVDFDSTAYLSLDLSLMDIYTDQTRNNPYIMDPKLLYEIGENIPLYSP